MITVLSLFDGLGGTRIALDRLGISCKYYASEIDKYAIRIAMKNYPDIIQLGDVKNIEAKNLPKIDLLIGGSPCQDLSVAKKDRKGLQGKRSGLFWDYVRILEELKPKYFVLENVNSMKKADKQIITDTLDVKPIIINSALLTAQNRKRLYWTNILDIKQPKDKNIYLKDILEYLVDMKYYISKESITKLIPILNRNREKNLKLVFVGGIISKRGLWLKNGKYYSRNFSTGNRVYSPKGKSVCLTATGGGIGSHTGLYSIYNKTLNSEKSNTIGSNSQCITAKTGQVLCVAQRGRYNPDGTTFQKLEINFSGKTNTLTLIQKDNYVFKINGVNYIIRRLTPIECERLQGLPDNYTEGVSNTQRYKMIGNGFTIPVIEHILKGIK